MTATIWVTKKDGLFRWSMWLRYQNGYLLGELCPPKSLRPRQENPWHTGAEAEARARRIAKKNGWRVTGAYHLYPTTEAKT